MKLRSAPSPRPLRREDETKSGPQRRMSRIARETQIVAGAIRFFAEEGLSGNTRDLARHLGITQPLLYRYFPTKQALLERIFNDLFLERLNASWTPGLLDRSMPLIDRICGFYERYSAATYSFEWIRLYMFLGLMGSDLNARYINKVEEEALKPICNEIRIHCGLPDQSVIPISRAELEHLWVFHGGLFYSAIRKHIYHVPAGEDFAATVARAAQVLLEGIRAVTRAGDGAGTPPLAIRRG